MQKPEFGAPEGQLEESRAFHKPTFLPPLRRCSQEKGRPRYGATAAILASNIPRIQIMERALWWAWIELLELASMISKAGCIAGSPGGGGSVPAAAKRESARF